MKIKRFQEWKQRKLREMLTEPITDGPHETPKLEEKGIPFISVDAIVDNKIDFDRKRGYISEATDELYSKKYKPQYNDVFLVKSGSTVGKTAIVETKKRFNIWSPLAAMRVGDVSAPYFLYYLLQTKELQNQVRDKASNGTQPNLGMRELEKFYTKITLNFDEQLKIGTFFKQLDNTITLHQQKYDLLLRLKKAYLQQMFTQKGESTPKVRFADFHDNWEQRKLSGVIEKLSGGASIKPTDYLEDGIRTIPKGAVSATGIADLSGSKYISEDFFEKNITSHVHTNNLVTSLRDLVPSAPNMGRIVRIEGDDEQFLMPQGVYKLELFKGMDEDFLISFSNSDKYRKIISAEKNGSTQVHIRNGEFLNIDINLPSKHEQKKIGTFFKILDNTIALHQQKIASLKSIKEAYLQKMFV